MKLIYITSKKYPSTKTDPFYVQSMANAFATLLERDFIFFVRGTVPDELKHMHTMSVRFPDRFRLFFYFFSLPILTLSRGWSTKDTFFLSYDPNLLSILIFWRGMFGFKYRVVSDWHQMFGDWRDAYVARRSDYLTTTSQRLKNILIATCGLAPEKILVAYGGVDPLPFIEKSKAGRVELRKKLNLPQDTFLAGYVGIFTSVGLPKGLDTMIEALPLLPQEVSMVFIGGSKQEMAEYRLLAQKLGVEERCIFVEKQPFEKVIEYELALDALVIPYPDKPHFRDYGFPMKVWEYMASGRPIVYSNLAIMGEILEKRATAFAPGDASSLAAAVSGVYQHRVQAEEVAGQNPTAAKAYTWEARARHILSFIHH